MREFFPITGPAFPPTPTPAANVMSSIERMNEKSRMSCRIQPVKPSAGHVGHPFTPIAHVG
jgi:hypothetical protein